MGRICLSFLAPLLCAHCFAQTAPVTSTPHSKIVFGDTPVATPLGQKGTIMTADYGCASDGSAFLVIADSPTRMNLTLHSLQGALDDTQYTDTRFDTPVLAGYKWFGWPYKYFINDRQVATLVDATISDGRLEETAPQQATLALLYDRKGAFQSYFRLPAEIDAKAVGVYGSGDLLIVSASKSTKAGDLFVLTPKGISSANFCFSMTTSARASFRHRIRSPPRYPRTGRWGCCKWSRMETI